MRPNDDKMLSFSGSAREHTAPEALPRVGSEVRRSGGACGSVGSKAEPWNQLLAINQKSWDWEVEAPAKLS